MQIHAVYQSRRVLSLLILLSLVGIAIPAVCVLSIASLVGAHNRVQTVEHVRAVST